jgi:hypothetical protein
MPRQRLAQVGTVPTFREADFGEFESEKAGGDEPRAVEPTGHGLGPRLAELERGEG